MKKNLDSQFENKYTIDLNADLGEGGLDDEAILACVSSANIACGGHAGDSASMRTAVRAAMRHQVAIGAHPSFVDRENFGRSAMHLPAAEVMAMVSAQIRALQAIAAEEGARLLHVKPHGALYNQAARDPMLARQIVQAVIEVDPRLCVVALSGSALISAAKQAGLAVAEEVFADRRYMPDGTLAPRNLPGATIDDVTLALQQVMRLIEDGQVLALDGQLLTLKVDTICLHGDGAHALELARLIRFTLEQKHILIGAAVR
ncbi:MAG: 5-oxoprolinase subunit PxpA [Undibacterium sp.]|nr:5-oxoprolinase subunit PxpA [Undibacterium sp.]